MSRIVRGVHIEHDPLARGRVRSHMGIHEGIGETVKLPHADPVFKPRERRLGGQGRTRLGQGADGRFQSWIEEQERMIVPVFVPHGNGEKALAQELHLIVVHFGLLATIAKRPAHGGR